MPSVAELEAFGKKGAQDDDIEVAKVYEKAGAKVSKLDSATVGKWRDIARDTAWKDYSAKTATVSQPAEARKRRLRMMHGPIADQGEPHAPAASNPLVAALARALDLCNRVIVILAGIALIAACVILSYSVLGRALFKSPNYWQDEAAVFLLVGATFMTAAYVQSQRGHVGIEAFVGLMSPLANRIRLWLVDVASFAFCAFFAWKSWTLAHEA